MLTAKPVRVAGYGSRMEHPVMLWGLQAETWTALAAIATALIAAAAVWFARGQVNEAKQLRRDQTQPFVVVDIAPNPSVSWVVDFTVKNIGLTLARNVRFTFDPELESSQERYQIKDSLLFKQGVPSLPPGKELRFMLDIGHERYEAKLPNVYKVRVTCDDARGRPVEALEYVCDLDLYMSLSQAGVHNIHDLTNEVAKIRKTLDGWTEDKALSVIAFEGWNWRERRDRQAAEREERWSGHLNHRDARDE